MVFISGIAYRLFGNHIRRYRRSYGSLEVLLRGARIPIPVEQYIATAYFLSLLVSFLMAVFGYFVTGYLLEYNVSVPGISPQIIQILIPLFFFFGGMILSYTAVIKYPSLKAATRKSYIELSLSYSVAYMYALSKGGGMNILDIMRSLSKQKHIYGVVSEEFGYVVRDVDYFAMDLITALKYEGRFSPSENFKLFLDGLVSVVSSGGNITAYLKSKTDQYKTLASYEQKRFLEILGILAEVYVTVFVVGPVFLMTILVVLGFLASDSLFILYILVYILIPAGTLLFIIFLSTISNELTSSKMRVTSEIMDEFDDVSISSVTAYDLGMLKQITRNYRLLQIKRTLLDPLTLMRAHPHYSFAITVPASLVYLFYSVRGYEDLILQSSFNPLNLQYMNLQAVSLLDDHLIYAFLIVALPFVAFYESHARWLRMVEGDLPDFLKRLASINEAGILLVDAIALVSKSKIGVLHTEVKKMVEYISWGSSLVEVLWKFEYRIRTDINSRIITLIIKASESTSDVISVLNIASSEADMENRLKKERSAEMLVYVFIVYISFLVFLFIVYVLAAYFVPALPEDLEGVGSGISINFGFDSEAFTLLFFHASLIQGFCSGLVAGKMGTGSIYSGVKHSVFMVLIAYVVFTLFI